MPWTSLARSFLRPKHWAFAAGLLAFACLRATSTPDAWPCADDSDCGGEERCFFAQQLPNDLNPVGVCSPLDHCEQDADCGGALGCVASGCRPVACSTTDPQSCAPYRCASDRAGCLTECDSVLECQDNARCTGHACIATECQKTSEGADCGGYSCLAGRCATDCTSSDCAAGYSCYGAIRCIPIPRGNGEVCRQSSECASSRCCTEVGADGRCADFCTSPGENGGTSQGGGGTGQGGTSQGGTSQGGTGQSAGPALGSLGQACSTEQSLACAGYAQKDQLVCVAGTWRSYGRCGQDTYCDTASEGRCSPAIPECEGLQSGDPYCSTRGVERCGADLVTTSIVTLCSGLAPACLDGACVACSPSSRRCPDAAHSQTCSPSGTWDTPAVCHAATPVCVAGTCQEQPSCSGLAASCGVVGADSCCSSSLVPGGTFDRSNDANYPATISDFRLDTYEVSVGRFRKFAAVYAQDMIPAGAGKNPSDSGDPGWDIGSNASLPPDQGTLLSNVRCSPAFQTWTAGNDELPINCIDWFEAQAFCIWDGGRLPTEAEWNYAAAGGSEQRQYPWGNREPAADAALAVYGCFWHGGGVCTSTKDIAPVGSVKAGVGKWGHADLAGNVFEWTRDGEGAPSAVPCNDCANTAPSVSRVIRGGAFNYGSYSLFSGDHETLIPAGRLSETGVRCARPVGD